MDDSTLKIKKFVEMYGERNEIYESDKWFTMLGIFTIGWEAALANKPATPAPAADGWISVKDRLPEKLATVLAWDGSYMEPATYRMMDSGGSDWFGISGNDINVTHWQPLPTPPTGGKA